MKRRGRQDAPKACYTPSMPIFHKPGRPSFSYSSQASTHCKETTEKQRPLCVRERERETGMTHIFIDTHTHTEEVGGVVGVQPRVLM